MAVSLVVLMCVLCGSAPELRSRTTDFNEPKTLRWSTNQQVSITFIGTVTSVETLGARPVSVIPVDPDPRFAITIHIEEIAHRGSRFKAGTDQVFAVHSPAKLFGAGEPEMIGKKYRFKIVWNRARNESSFSNLTVSSIPA